ncbi:hypothetical protein [Ensifer aridi]|uniref:hypothetical protein n=1 Tax=Ensifer aridi TaxID=1708715 RepID=UPI000A100704|nr:hypothetical protein [Ensifer aridi]
MKTIKVEWVEEGESPALAVQFPRMWPFQIEEVEQVARDLGFGIEEAGHQRPLGFDSDVWTVPGPGYLISNQHAVEALRAALSKLGYEIIFERGDSNPEEPEGERDKTTVAVESMIKSLSALDLNEEQLATFAAGQQLYQTGQINEAFKLLRDLGRPIWTAHFDEAIKAGGEEIEKFHRERNAMVRSQKIVAATWLKDPLGALHMSYPLGLPKAERLLVERLGTQFGFDVQGQQWMAPKNGVSVVAWQQAMSTAGFIVHFQDSVAMVQDQMKMVTMIALATEGRVAPFHLQAWDLTEDDAAKVREVASNCSFRIEGDVWSPPDMNEGWLNFRNKMRAAGFLVRIIHREITPDHPDWEEHVRSAIATGQAHVDTGVSITDVDPETVEAMRKEGPLLPWPSPSPFKK